MPGYGSLVLVSPPVEVVLLLDMNPKDIGFRKAWATRPRISTCKHRLNVAFLPWCPFKILFIQGDSLQGTAFWNE